MTENLSFLPRIVIWNIFLSRLLLDKKLPFSILHVTCINKLPKYFDTIWNSWTELPKVSDYLTSKINMHRQRRRSNMTLSLTSLQIQITDCINSKTFARIFSVIAYVCKYDPHLTYIKSHVLFFVVKLTVVTNWLPLK